MATKQGSLSLLNDPLAQELLQSTFARQIVRKLVDGRIAFTPEPKRGVCVFTGRAAYGRLLAGTVLQNRWCPRGDSNTRHAV